MTGISDSGLLVSLMSPFDFDGPVVEIVTAVLTFVGFVLKKVSNSKLKNINEDEFLDEEDKKSLLTVSENLGKAINAGRSR